MTKFGTLLLCTLAGQAFAADLSFRIPNELGLAWPGELVSFDVPAGRIPAEPLTMTIQGRSRPVQVERVTIDGKAVDRLWTVATLEAVTGSVPLSATAALSSETADSPLTLSREKGALVIANGVHEFRITDYPGPLPAPVPLSALPHWLGGLRVKGQAAWDGRAFFDGSSRVRAARTEILRQGPVYIDVRITYAFEDPGEDGTCSALPLELGKQTFRWKPNELPSETVPKRQRHYEALLRFTAGDPWVEVNERFHLPPDPSVKDWGIHQYVIHWGPPPADVAARSPLPASGFMALDTVTWVPWFEYDQFGGNTEQKYQPAVPRPAQKGRPFALLRPRWNQGGGGSQDFILTAGGAPAKGAEPGDAPSAGVIAAFASKWVNPFANTISAYALDGTRGYIRCPLRAEDRGAWYSSRSYALCAGPKSAFANLNGLVRRHTDWTLNGQINKYVLSWKGHEAMAAPKGKSPVPTAQLFLQRRYQDDFLNPTQRQTRDLKKYEGADSAAMGPWNAALGYIFTDFDHWPGWHNGWTPGNPNFHTDKYMGTIYLGLALKDHPHASEWLAYGKSNFDEDTRKVFLPPDGVGWECPGYSGYSMGHQLDVALKLRQAGLGDPVRENPLFGKSATWHRNLLTPVDPRLGRRHEAPIGDTHRWDSGLGAGFGKLALLAKDTDPALAGECASVYKLLKESGGIPEKEKIDVSIAPAKLAGLDWSSRAYEGFGAVLRSRFGTPRETFLSLKAGQAQGHYHNDELSFHYYADGTPVSLDYNCSYHPRGDAAVLHNTVTFGRDGTVANRTRGHTAPAMEQGSGAGAVTAFVSRPAADLIVAERRLSRLYLYPYLPEDAEFSRDYDSESGRDVKAAHRRSLLLVKHPAASPFTDYLVVREETLGGEPQQLNLHLLAREAALTGSLIRCTGQWKMDMTVFLARADDLRLETREWFYADEYMTSPGAEYTPRPGESTADWKARLPAELPRADWKPVWVKPEENRDWLDLVKATRGRALMPPPGWTGTWLYGECQLWLRLHTKPGSPLVWVLYPRPQNGKEPVLQSMDGGTRVTVTLDGHTDEIVLDPAEGIRVTQDGEATGLTEKGTLPPFI